MCLRWELKLIDLQVDHMPCRRELEMLEAEAEAKKRDERRRQERKNRDAFTALLRRHAAEGLLTARMRFKVRQVGHKARFAVASRTSNTCMT